MISGKAAKQVAYCNLTGQWQIWGNKKEPSGVQRKTAIQRHSTINSENNRDRSFIAVKEAITPLIELPGILRVRSFGKFVKLMLQLSR